MQPLIPSPLYNAQLTRSMGCTTYQGAEIGECLAIADQIKPGDKESWYAQWLLFAERNYALGKSYQKNGMKHDANMAYLRACTYYRTAFFFLEDAPNDKRIESALEMSVQSFHHAIDCFDFPVEKISIPFEGYDLPGYLYINPHTGKSPQPLIIDTGGGDGTKEETYFNTAAEALKRGVHCLTFDGPGQGSVLRLNKKPFIHDWERVIEKVVDYVLQRPEVDTQKIILWGTSFGGYLASRAVSKEKRIAACIVDPGIYDSFSNFESKFTSLAKTQYPELKDAPLHQIIEHAISKDENSRFMLISRLWRFGAKNIEDMIKEIRKYNLEGIANQIQCPMLVCDNTLEYITLGQAKKLYDHLQCQKKYLLFNAEDGTGGHCEPLARRLVTGRVYEWLREVSIVS